MLQSDEVFQAIELHDRLYREQHPGQTGRGVPALQDPWRAKGGYEPGWLEKYGEAWDQLET